MTHTVHPYAHRLGILRDWRSRWFAPRGEYQRRLKADVLLRSFLTERLKGMHVSAIEMKRDAKTLTIVVRTSRPGLIIGRGGEGSTKLDADLRAFTRRKQLAVPENIKVSIEEVRSPESNAALVAQSVAESLEKRMSFRRVLKQTVEKVMANRDVKGVRVALAGRLGGSDMARREEAKRGRVPLQTFRSDIDFAKLAARTPQGAIGVKVWIYKGEVFDDDASPAV